MLHDFEINSASAILLQREYSGGECNEEDIGYYIGHKICEAYYKNAADKKQAIKDILEIKDFDQFVKTSRYEEKIKAG